MTKQEQAYQQAVRDQGCIVCHLYEGVRSDCDIHHILDGGRRISESMVLGLCAIHHRAGFNDELRVSRHPYKAAFVRRYGSEQWLKDQQDKRLERAA